MTPFHQFLKNESREAQIKASQFKETAPSLVQYYEGQARAFEYAAKMYALDQKIEAIWTPAPELSDQQFNYRA